MAREIEALARILKGAAKQYGGRVSSCNVIDPNVCTTAFDWRVTEVTPPPDRFVLQAKLQYCGRRVTIRSNNQFIVIELSADLAQGLVFSVNRGDRVMGTEPSPLTVGQQFSVFVNPDLVDVGRVASFLRVPAVERAIEALELGPDESVQVYQNGVTAYTRPNSEHRLETLLMGLAAFIDQLPAAGEVRLELEDLPIEFHPLFPLIQKWGHTDDEERGELLSGANTPELRDLVMSLEPCYAAINRHLDRFDGVSMPPSAIALGALAECGIEAKLLLAAYTNDKPDA